MNISSVVINVADLNLMSEIANLVSDIDGCEVVAQNENKIVVLIESQSFDDEIKSYKSIERLPGIATVSMIYSYQNLDEDIEKSNNNNIGDILRKIDESSVDDIEYHGNPTV
ncbi:nitrate reductase formation protein NapD [Campylobacter hyointestinalis subsp. hyointestinalis]|uniref:Chaperone NapD n=1 Tax=Campylobacter hyointestinalis subsp. hyointestinalis TaxID=91352 RepID=A0A9W5APD1_CAMHY|nr:chaperone NapD [Campylobacter hyointestinalis]PPB57040.1 nitrate reductase formation protein NapD [Campylobacter hyointestinalis subsp. hyointestinalis]QCT99680.1 nitrate reductase formation protein NapD [Campylobacter hyointestinalis subsp. hyointestinalis]CUU78326.1 NapD protein [Campylobacter hyointestinalis subsp. hyointestinalis]CUU84860.1 NapD protein [Campylobacter hyointestinalis subsp. hyointestinalis]CUU90349.1 NapD protein [Campylobacter hyointestinalis subsp. hyointestinalis]